MGAKWRHLQPQSVVSSSPSRAVREPAKRSPGPVGDEGTRARPWEAQGLGLSWPGQNLGTAPPSASSCEDGMSHYGGSVPMRE